MICIKKLGYIDINTNILTTAENVIPVFNSSKFSSNYFSKENIVDYVSFDSVLKNNEDYYAFITSGDSMEPLFSQEDIAIIHKQDYFESGNTCLVLIGNALVIRKIIETNTGIDLLCMNPYYPIQHFTSKEINKLPVKILGRVIEARKRKIFE